MADIEYVEPVEATSELFNRPNKSFAVKGQAAFFSVALHLGIPIIGSGHNIDSMMSPSYAGVGRSSTVLNFVRGYQADLRTDFVNNVPTDWFASHSSAENAVQLQYVLKRINTDPDSSIDDARHLASMVNEMRILAVRSLRASPNIVSLLGISWFEHPSRGRFWPQLLIESARYGTLGDFVTSETLSFSQKSFLSCDILCGLQFLHLHGIVHCDLKPANILIFADLDSGRGDLSEIGMKQVCAKICDFGSAVILLDYSCDRPFQARVGTVPWMPLEFELSLPVEVGLLHKADIYSYGLVMAYIFMDGLMPFHGMTPVEITEAKLDETRCYQTILEEVERHISADEKLFVSLLLIFTLLPNPENRFDLGLILPYLKLGIILSLAKDSSSQSSRIENNARKHVVEGDSRSLSNSVNFIFPEESVGSSSWTSRVRSTVSSYIISGRNFLDRTLTHHDSSEDLNLYNAIFSKRYVKTDLVPQIDPESKHQSSSRRSSSDDDENLIDSDTDEKESSSKVSTVPDMCQEINFRSSKLPVVAVKELFDDLKKQSDREDCNPEVLYALSGCYFNGSITAPNPELGLKYLAKAAALGHSNSIYTFYNISESCLQTVPRHITNLMDDMYDKIFQNVWALSPKVIKTEVSWTTSSESIMARMAIEKFPERFNAYLNSDMQKAVRGSFIAILNLVLLSHATTQVQSQRFDFSNLKSWQGSKIYVHSSDLDMDSFKSEVVELGCIEYFDTLGMTLLQQAVAHDDKPMVIALLDELAVNIENFGETNGWTPLWISCLQGSFGIAKELLQRNASITCFDTEFGSTILHMLHLFSNRTEIKDLLSLIISQKKLDIDQPSKNEMTPLQTTFTGFDYSLGAAARALLEKGANPTIQTADKLDFVTPISLCVLRLDVVLLQEMLLCPWVVSRENDPTALKGLAQAKAQAFRSIVNRTEFYFRSAVGGDWRSSLVAILKLLIDPEMIVEYGSSKLMNPGVTPLESALYMGRHFLAEMLITQFPPPSGARDRHGRPLLHIAIERRMRKSVRDLIEHGASILEKDEDNQTALHISAHYFPSILLDLIEVLETTNTNELGDKTITQVLQEPNCRGFDIAGLLITEGYHDELEISKTLCAKYSLDLDIMRTYGTLAFISLAGAMIGICVNTGLVPTSQIQYLLQFSPRPRFICSEKGLTLLSIAVSGNLAHTCSLDYAGHQLVQSILESYPEIENLAIDEEGCGPLHRAALWSNQTALELMQKHVRAHEVRNPGQSVQFSFLLNKLTTNGHTVLDYASNSFRRDPMGDGDELEETSSSFAMRRKAAISCYKYLRSQGALHSPELIGIITRSRMIYPRFAGTTDDWQDFVVKLAYTIGVELIEFQAPVVMTHDDTDPEVVQGIQNNPALAGKVGKTRVIQLVWLFDCFRIQSFDFIFSPWKAKEHLKAYNERVLDKSYFALYRSQDDEELLPWNKTTYTQKIMGVDETITWTRPGLTWTNDEMKHLCEEFGRVWDEAFGEAEEELKKRGTPVLVTDP